MTHENGCRFSDPSELENPVIEGASRAYFSPSSSEALDAVNDEFEGPTYPSSVINFCTDGVRDLTDRQLKAKLLSIVHRVQTAGAELSRIVLQDHSRMLVWSEQNSLEQHSCSGKKLPQVCLAAQSSQTGNLGLILKNCTAGSVLKLYCSGSPRPLTVPVFASPDELQHVPCTVRVQVSMSGQAEQHVHAVEMLSGDWASKVCVVAHVAATAESRYQAHCFSYRQAIWVFCHLSAEHGAQSTSSCKRVNANGASTCIFVWVGRLMYSSCLNPVHILSCQRHKAMHSLQFVGVVIISHWVSDKCHAFCSVHGGPASALADARTSAQDLPAASCAVVDTDRWSSYLSSICMFT